MEAAEAAQEKKNKTHEISFANGVKFCRYCGIYHEFTDKCTRERGHKYNVKRVMINKYTGPSAGYEYVCICKNCGRDSDLNPLTCN